MASNIKEFLKDTLIYIPSKLIQGVMGIVGIMYYTQFFLPEEYGEYSLVMTGLGLTTASLFGWLSHSSLRFFGDNQERKEFITTLFILWLSMIIIFIICMSISVSISSLISKYVYLILLLFIAMGSWMIFQSLLRAARKPQIYSVLISFSQIFKFLITLLLVKKFDFGIEALMIAVLIVESISFFLSAAYLNVFKYIRLEYYSTNVAKELFNYGLPLVGVAIISWTLKSSDKIMIGFLRNEEEVGLYSIGYSVVAQPITLILTSIMLSAFPILIKVWEKDGSLETEKIIKSILRYFFMLMIPAFFGLVLLKEEIFTYLVNEKYYEANTLLPWIGIGLIFMGLTQYTNKIWELTKKTKMVFLLTAISGLTNIILNLLLIPTLGYKAAAITTFISYLLYFLISSYLGKKHLNIKINSKSLLLVTFAALTMSLVIKFTETWINSLVQLGAIIFMSALIYILVLSVLGETKNELKFIKSKL